MKIVGQRQKAWAKVARKGLAEALGGKCCKCATQDALEFDCIIPQGDAHHRMEASARMSFYRAQHRANNLQLLCEVCHRKKTINE